MRFWHSDWTVYIWHINPKWHAVAFHTKPFSSLTRTWPGMTSIVPIGSRSSRRRVQLKASLKKSLTLLHQISIIRPPHYLPQGTLLKLMFSTPPIRQKIFPLSGIMCWSFMMTYNQPLIMFLWLTPLMLTHCLRYIHGCGVALIYVMWYHRIRMSLTSKMAGSPKAFHT